MKKTKTGVRRICSLLLCVMLVLAMLPAAAWANETLYTIDFSDGTINGNVVTYKVNDDTNVTLTVSGISIGNNNTISIAESDAVTFSLSENYNAETMEVKVYASDGFNTTLTVENSVTSLSKREAEVLPDTTLKLKVCAKSNNPPEPGPEPGDEPVHGGYAGEQKTASGTVSGKADFYINDSRMVNVENKSFDDVSYTYDGKGYVDFYFNCFVGERITALKINDVDYYNLLPTPSTEEGKAALLEACKGQLNEFKITVPYSESGYAIESSVKGLDDTDKDYMVVGNFLWTYTDQNQGDDYIDHGRMELVSVEYGNNISEPDDLNNPGTAYDWSQNENGGSAVLPVGAVVTVKLVPDYGYQLTSFGINGGNFGTGDEQSTFTFEIKPGNAHLGAHFTQVEDKVSSSTSAVTNGSIQLGQNEINTGTVVLSVSDASANEATRNGFTETVRNNENTADYEIASILDINLDQVLYKGTESGNDVWSNEMNALTNSAGITLALAEDYGDVVVIHEKHDNTYEVIDTSYDSTTGTISFNTDSFSNYAIAATSKQSQEPPTVPSYTPPVETDSVKNDSASGTTTADVKPVVKDNTASAEIDTKTAESLVSATIKNQSKEVVIDATANTSAAADSTTTAEVGIPAATLGVIAEKTGADVTVKTDVAEIKLDNAAAGAVAEQASGDTVQLIVEKVDDNKNKVEFQLKVVCSDGNVISDFKGGNVAITVAVPKDMADKKVVCVYIDDNGHMSKVKGQMNADGTFTFTTGHFSTYAILAEEEADAAIAEQKAAIKNIDIKLTSKQVKTKSGKKGIKITWTADAGDKNLDGIEIYRSTERYKGYGTKPFYATKNGKTEGYYINTKSLKTGTKYYYRVRGYILVDGQKVYTDYSNKAWRTVK